jgi:hypothetical protein
MPGRIKFVFGLANDELGYIIPKLVWAELVREYGLRGAHYGAP